MPHEIVSFAKVAAPCPHLYLLLVCSDHACVRFYDVDVPIFKGHDIDHTSDGRQPKHIVPGVSNVLQIVWFDRGVTYQNFLALVHPFHVVAHSGRGNAHRVHRGAANPVLPDLFEYGDTRAESPNDSGVNHNLLNVFRPDIRVDVHGLVAVRPVRFLECVESAGRDLVVYLSLRSLDAILDKVRL